MAVEAKRGCGYRRVHGTYLVGELGGFGCHRLPLKLYEHAEFFRGYKEINPKEILGKCYNCDSAHQPFCVVCNPPDEDVHGLMFVGEQYYTPQGFLDEAASQGISKRISRIPNNLELGKTIVYLAHRKCSFGNMQVPAVFMAFRPQRVEQLIWESENVAEIVEEMKAKGITPVVIPDGDREHR